MKAGASIYMREGILGLYRGYMPSLIIYSAMFFDDLTYFSRKVLE
jgi:hypothetical protein